MNTICPLCTGKNVTKILSPFSHKNERKLSSSKESSCGSCGATRIVEEELSHSGGFQYLAILHDDKVTGIREGKRDYGLQIEVRCWESTDARIGSPTRLSRDTLDQLAERLTKEVPGVISPKNHLPQ